AAGRARELLRDADVLINVAGINRIPPERRAGLPAICVDIDPAFTQVKAAMGDALLRAILDEHDVHATVGANIGTPRSPVPTAGYTWHPTRPPVAIACWADAGDPGPSYTTVGRWNESTRDLTWGGEPYRWRKRPEGLGGLDP